MPMHRAMLSGRAWCAAGLLAAALLVLPWPVSQARAGDVAQRPRRLKVVLVV